MNGAPTPAGAPVDPTVRPGSAAPSDPARFFSAWVPEVAAHLRPAEPLVVQVTVAGEGTWTLRSTRSGLEVVAGGVAAADVALGCSLADWRALMVGGGTPDLRPARSPLTDVLFLDPLARPLVKAVSGRLRLSLPGFQGRGCELTVAFGAARSEGFDTEVTLAPETFVALLAREVTPPELVARGELAFTGVPQLAMVLALAMMG